MRKHLSDDLMINEQFGLNSSRVSRKVRSHLAECSECARKAEALRVKLAQLDTARGEEELPEPVVANVLRAVRKTRPESAMTWSRFVWIASPVVAVLLLVTLLPYSVTRKQDVVAPAVEVVITDKEKKGEETWTFGEHELEFAEEKELEQLEDLPAEENAFAAAADALEVADPAIDRADAAPPEGHMEMAMLAMSEARREPMRAKGGGRVVADETVRAPAPAEPLPIQRQVQSPLVMKGLFAGRSTHARNRFSEIRTETLDPFTTRVVFVNTNAVPATMTTTREIADSTLVIRCDDASVDISRPEEHLVEFSVRVAPQSATAFVYRIRSALPASGGEVQDAERKEMRE